MRLKKTYEYALLSSLYITMIAFLAVLTYAYFSETMVKGMLIVFVSVFFCVIFCVIQYRSEKFLYNRVKKIYQEKINSSNKT